MSDGPVKRWLTSRKNLAGMAGALVGASLAFVEVSAWPVAAVGLYAVGALIGPRDPRPQDEGLTDALRADAAELVRRLRPRSADLPEGSLDVVVAILDVLRIVLRRLDEVADQPADRAAAPERLARAAEIIRVDLPLCLDAYLGRAPASTAGRAAVDPAAHERAVAELAAQLDLIMVGADRLARSVPDVHVQRALDLTRELRRRHGDPPAAG